MPFAHIKALQSEKTRWRASCGFSHATEKFKCIKLLATIKDNRKGDKMELVGIGLIIAVISQVIFDVFFIVLMAVGKKTPINTIDWTYY